MDDSPLVAAGFALLRHSALKSACDGPVDLASWLFTHAVLEERLAAVPGVRPDVVEELTQDAAANRAEALRMIVAGECR